MDAYEKIEKRIEDGDVIVDFIIRDTKYKARVVGFNLSIGATFIEDNNSNHYLLCTYGPLSPLIKHTVDPNHDAYMSLLLSGIEKGSINWDEIKMELSLIVNGGASSKTCSFNQ